jgi:hypothetical protein
VKRITEKEWFAAKSVVPLREWVKDHLKTALRKQRLFATACCYRLWDHLKDERSRKAIEASEKFADGMINKKALIAARISATAAARKAPEPPVNSGVSWTPEDAAQILANLNVSDMLIACTARVLYATANLGLRTRRAEEAEQAKLIRDVFGNPFRPAVFDASWRSDTVLSLAKGMYGSRDFSAMPVLADALQDMGCEATDILNHCRDESIPHVRGCWVVDLVLNK